MSEFGDETFDQRVLDYVKMAMENPYSNAERMKAIKAMARIMNYWMEDMPLEMA